MIYAAVSVAGSVSFFVRDSVGLLNNNQAESKVDGMTIAQSGILQ